MMDSSSIILLMLSTTFFTSLGFEEHYVNMSVQYTAIFHGCKNDNFQMKFFDFFFLFLLKT